MRSARWRSKAAWWCALIGIAALVASDCAKRTPPAAPAPPPRSRELAFTATAYCTGTRTAAGTRPNETIVAADPNVLPLGSRIRISGLAKRYNRVYTVMDTGSSIRGRRIDLYMRDCNEAVKFGRRPAKVSVVH